MLVYGIRCAPNDLINLPDSAVADYYMDYGLLVFPSYTRPSCVQSGASGLTAAFWERVRMMMQFPLKPHTVDAEHPWITEEEHEVVCAIKAYHPRCDTEWYYVPRTAGTSGADADADTDAGPELMSS
jgi:hypothetical protein